MYTAVFILIRVALNVANPNLIDFSYIRQGENNWETSAYNY